MQYYGIIKNDVTAGQGVCVSFFVQGCPHRCPGCHNPDSWNFDGGKEFTPNTLKEINDAIGANGVIRNLCIMGGEPLCPENQFLTYLVITEVKKKYPDIKVYIWTGYEFKDLKKDENRIKQILDNTDFVIDGPFIQELRDITLAMRGSSNQRIYQKINDEFVEVNIE